jgi:spore coat polysaccharide biosynthesis protein SpsF (cytidylyltransferase family)
MTRTAIILQARMGSRRLPGKSLASIGNRTVLAHAVIRLQASELPVIVATTTGAEDDAIEAEARRHGALVFRGDRDDVIGRYIAAARTFEIDTIVRATGDNPLVDGDGPRRVVELLRNVRADHVVECGLPVGAAVEAVGLAALERARTLLSDPYDREHVTSLVRRDARFQSLRAMAPRHLRRPGLRLTVDTAEDLDFVQRVLGTFDESAVPPLADVIQAADALLVRSAVRQRLQRGA